MLRKLEQNIFPQAGGQVHAVTRHADGVLALKLPKAQQARARRIAVEAA